MKEDKTKIIESNATQSEKEKYDDFIDYFEYYNKNPSLAKESFKICTFNQIEYLLVKLS